MFDYISYTVCEFFLSALINGDNTAFNDEDDEQYDKFIKTVEKDVNGADWHVDVVEDSENFSFCDICRLKLCSKTIK